MKRAARGHSVPGRGAGPSNSPPAGEPNGQGAQAQSTDSPSVGGLWGSGHDVTARRLNGNGNNSNCFGHGCTRITRIKGHDDGQAAPLAEAGGDGGVVGGVPGVVERVRGGALLAAGGSMRTEHPRMQRLAAVTEGSPDLAVRMLARSVRTAWLLCKGRALRREVEAVLGRPRVGLKGGVVN